MSEGVYVRIHLPDVVLSDAVNLVEDPVFWDETMPPVLHHFHMNLNDYWSLTVRQHRLLVDYLIARGLHGES
jgi:hypothetical protein